jgi:hypothetical protein
MCNSVFATTFIPYNASTKAHNNIRSHTNYNHCMSMFPPNTSANRKTNSTPASRIIYHSKGLLKQRFVQKIRKDGSARVIAVPALMYSILLYHSKMCFHKMFFRKQKYCEQNSMDCWRNYE